MNPGGFDYEGWLFQNGIRARIPNKKNILPVRMINFLL